MSESKVESPATGSKMVPPPRQEALPHSDCLVMFGITGDLAKKKLFPAVYRLQSRGLLSVPVVGLALDDWTEEDLRSHAKESLDEAGERSARPHFEPLRAKRPCVSGDYAAPQPSPRLKTAVAGAEHPV